MSSAGSPAVSRKTVGAVPSAARWYEAGDREEAERDGPAEDGDFEEPDREHSVVAILRRGGEQTGVERVRLAIGAPAVAGRGGTSVGHGCKVAETKGRNQVKK